MILCKIRRLIYSNEADLTVSPIRLRMTLAALNQAGKENNMCSQAVCLERRYCAGSHQRLHWGLTFSPNLFIRIFAKTRCRDSEAPYSLQMLKSFQLTQSRHAQSKVLLAIRDLIQWWLIVSSPWFCPILIRGLRSRGSVFCVSEGTDSSNAWTVGRITWNFMLEETQDDFGTIHFRGPVFRATSFSSFSSQLVPIQY